MTLDVLGLLPKVIQLAEKAGEAILPIYRSQSEVLLSLKNDGSPLTQADLLANTIICDALKQLTPQIPILSEESCDIPFVDRQAWQRYWLIDPIDGTKEFLAKNGDFTVNIALIEFHQSLLGVVAVPIEEVVYYGAKGAGAWKKMGEESRKIHTAKLQAATPVRILASRRHGQIIMEKIQQAYPECQLSRRGSSLKFCLIAEGLADIYPRLGLTSEWDTGAAQCILEEAGGKVMNLDGFPLSYGLRDSYQNPYFLAVGDPKVEWQKFFYDKHSS
jgi:3'(2'), 5'-bisphosphate nucleotidase